MHRIDVKVVFCARSVFDSRVEYETVPLFIRFLESKPPIEFFAVEIEYEQAIEPGGRQENAPVLAYDFMAVFQITTSKRLADLEISVKAKQFVTGGDVDVVAIERDATQTAFCAAAVEIDLAAVPVNVLLTCLGFEVDRVNAAVTFVLLAAAHDGRRNEFG